MKTKYFDIPEKEEIEQKTKTHYHCGYETVEVTENIFFRAFGKDMVIPKGFDFDGNSFPFYIRAFKSKYDVRWLFAGLVHDYIYRTQFIPKTIADLIYYYILVATAGKWYARVFYYGVHLGGGKAWRDNEKHLEKFPKAKPDLRKYILSLES